MSFDFNGSDALELYGLRFEARLGVERRERDSPQAVFLDLQLYLDLRPAARSDRIGQTIDYRKVQQAIRELLCVRRFKLIERLAQELVELLFQRWPQIQAIRVRLKKPSALPNGEYACVVLCRERPAPPAARRAE